MASAKEIRTKIKSIKSTQKITRAMEMVAASKMRKAQKRMQRSRPYSSRVRDVIGHLSQGRLEVDHPYLVERPVKRVGFMVVSTDRGLCGGLNINLFKEILREMSLWNEKKVAVDCCIVGNKANSFFSKYGANIIRNVEHIGDDPQISNLIGAVKVMLDAYEQKKIDRVFFAYNKFVNTMTQDPTLEILLPIIDPCKEQRRQCWDYLYEPEATVLLEALLKRYVESLVYQGVVENMASEQAARMVAMKSASDNAADLIDDFQLMYNKARQAAITQELSEIVAGAAAV